MGLYEKSDSFLTVLEEHAVALTNLPTDQALFLMSQVVSIPLAFVLQFVLTGSRVGETVRHLYCLSIGITFNIICFRYQIINVLAPALVVFAVLKFCGRSASLGKGVLAGSMLWLSANHIWRQYSDYGSYKLDITGPLMIFTQKISLLAYAYEDGQKPESDSDNAEHKKHRLERLPSFLGYCSYLFGFMGFQTGPCYFYDDYLLFIQGRNLIPYHRKKKSDSDQEDMSLSSQSAEVKYPSPNYTFVINFIACILCGVVVNTFCPLFQISEMAEPEFIRDTSIAYKLVYCYIGTLLYRFRYYFAWKLGESICYAGGFGFTGWSADGTEQWDLIKNCAMVKLETATSFKVVFDEWNKQTAKWLRFICYSRITNKTTATNAVFALSAAWHGFYPGYYVTFGQGMLFVAIGRKVRKLVRPRFQSSSGSQMAYGVITFLATHAALSFGVVAQILLRLSLVYKAYLSMYFYIPILSFILLYCPIPKPRDEQKQQQQQKMKAKEKEEPPIATEGTSNTMPSSETSLPLSPMVSTEVRRRTDAAATATPTENKTIQTPTPIGDKTHDS
ncbi:lysophospholipid acyltransferase 6-like [Convolutriloba macropyga]|uniref:lysophospholipid acyltransferase 6-like n=1 Tax=Convolutriloba macropyga TaxID=536237 RepID=UPI003F5238E4